MLFHYLELMCLWKSLIALRDFQIIRLVIMCGARCDTVRISLLLLNILIVDTVGESSVISTSKKSVDLNKRSSR